MNLGSTEEISVKNLAEKIVTQLNSKSTIEFVPYNEIYGDGFADMLRRVPSIAKVQQLIGWSPRHDLSQIIDDVAAQLRS